MTELAARRRGPSERTISTLEAAERTKVRPCFAAARLERSRMTDASSDSRGAPCYVLRESEIAEMKLLTLQCGVASAGLVLLSTACVERQVVVKEPPPPIVVEEPSGQVVAEPPPAPKVEVITTSPGADHVWVGGFWVWRGGAWYWTPGHWVVRPHTHAVWIAGSWRHQPRGWVWIPGHWS
jgi:hypothetical protein